jgi:hypothetical protein
MGGTLPLTQWSQAPLPISGDAASEVLSYCVMQFVGVSGLSGTNAKAGRQCPLFGREAPPEAPTLSVPQHLEDCFLFPPAQGLTRRTRLPVESCGRGDSSSVSLPVS